MSYFNNNKWWVIMVVILVVLNAATLTIFFIERSKGVMTAPMHQRGGNTKDYLNKELGFDSVQQIKYEQLITEHRQQNIEIRAEIRHAKDSFFALLSDSATLDTAIKKAAIRVANIQQQMDVLTFFHFKKIRSVCNAQQRVKFDSVIKNAVKMMAPPSMQMPPPPPQNGKNFRPPYPPPPDGERMQPPPPKNVKNVPPPTQ